MENEYAQIIDGKTYLTDKAFDLFFAKVMYWIDFFGLTEWSVTVTKKEEDMDLLAFCNRDGLAKMATITLCMVWPTNLYGLDDIKKKIEKTAFHESLHILYGALYYMSMRKKRNEKLRYGEEEGIIHRLEKLLLLINKSEKENN